MSASNNIDNSIDQPILDRSSQGGSGRVFNFDAQEQKKTQNDKIYYNNELNETQVETKSNNSSLQEQLAQQILEQEMINIDNQSKNKLSTTDNKTDNLDIKNKISIEDTIKSTKQLKNNEQVVKSIQMEFFNSICSGGIDL